MTSKKSNITRWLSGTGFVLAFVLLLTACKEQTDDIRFQDLTAPEQLYIERVVILERAKAIALVDRETGNTLLDSLATAWGDSSLFKTRASAPRDPGRAKTVATLLRRILAAERDSLLATSGTKYLTAPIPDAPPSLEKPDK